MSSYPKRLETRFVTLGNLFIAGGYSRQFSIGVCRQGSQTLTLFKGRKSRMETLLKAQNQEMAPYLKETK